MSLSIENISKKYRKKTVLENVSINAEYGTQIGILGKNGSGKSTLLSILSGILPGDTGKFLVDGADLLKNTALRNKYCAYVPQEVPLIGELSARDNLKMWYDNDKLKKELESGFLKVLGVDEFIDVRVSRMSGGMKKRLSIGCAISEDPKILLLDEPTAALDLICKDIIYDYLRAFKNKGGIVLLATHDEKEIAECDSLYVISEGIAKPVSFDGSVKELLKNF